MLDNCVAHAKVSHNEVRAFGSEPCRLFRLALHSVFCGVRVRVRVTGQEWIPFG